MRDSSSSELAKLKLDYENKIEKLKSEHETHLNEEIFKIRRELSAEYEQKIEDLKEALDKDDSDKSISIDSSISNDNFKKLKDQVKLSKELDNEILGKVNHNLLGSRALNKSDQIPADIKDILEKLDNEGILLLSLSEILKLKSHLLNSQQSQTNRSDLEESLIVSAEKTEKDQLIQEIYQLREMLSKLNNSNLEDGDSRSEFMNALSNIFSNQKDLLVSELRCFITKSAYLDSNNYLGHLENKIDDLTKLNEKSIEYLSSTDRESLIDELKSARQDLEKCLNEINSLQENERQLKRECESLISLKDKIINF